MAWSPSNVPTVTKDLETETALDEIASGLWQKLDSLLREQLADKLSPQGFATWFGGIAAHSYSEAEGLHLLVPNNWVRTWLTKHYLPLMQDLLSDITASKTRITLTVDESLAAQATEQALSIPRTDEQTGDGLSSTPPSPHGRADKSHHFLPQFTFDTFVEAECNRFAYNACRRVAEHPDATFNPLIIYGGTGLGKTHLLRAIENYLVARRGDLNTVFVSSERFMNELVDHLKRKTPSAFRTRFRSADVLLIDDINKWRLAAESTQDEFLNTFNDLYLDKKQIVVSSNVHPRQSELSGPIKSRFDGGLVLEVSAPTVETSAAIISKKAEDEKIKLPTDVIYLVANRYHTSIRMLEGALKRIVFYAETYKCDKITVDIANNALADLPSTSEQRPSLDKIIHTVSLHFDTRFDDLLAASRKKSIAYPRHLAMYLCRKLTSHSLPEIGQKFGGRDHTTVLHAINKIKKQVAKPSSSTASDVATIESIIKNSALAARH